MILLGTLVFISLHPMILQQFAQHCCQLNQCGQSNLDGQYQGVVADILRGWFINAVCNERRKKSHELYQRWLYANLTPEELKSETHRVMWWAIKSARDSQKDEELNKYTLYDDMPRQDVYNEYIARRYDRTMLLRNVAGNGGL